MIKKICAVCGKEFETNNPQKIYCDGSHYLPCPVCGKPVLKIGKDFTIPPKCCSPECTHTLRQRKFKPRICEFCGKEFIPKSGVQKICDDTHYKKCEICGKEFIYTMKMKSNGVTTCSRACTKEKMRRNYNEKYGADHPMKSEITQKNFHNAMLKKYGVKHALQIPGKMKQQQIHAYETNMKNNGVPYACLTKACQESEKNLISEKNKKFAKRLEASGLSVEFEKSVESYSYDIHIIGTNILIEIDPTYTHNAVGNHWSKDGKDKYYHLNKTKCAERNGYRCIHIFDWDKIESIINLLKPIKRRIYARNCKLYKINEKYGDEFLNENHLQGACRGQLLYLGLVYEDELVEIMTFGKARYNKNYDIELLRLCTKSGTSVIGGASKLFKFATDGFDLYNIISYCDISKFSGNVYEKIGMKYVKSTPPQEIWSHGTEHITANLLRQRGYDQIFKTNYGKGTSNEQLMLENGWLPIYDCGQLVYEFKE